MQVTLRGRHITKVFSRSLLENVVIFKSKRITNSTHFLYSYVAVRYLRIYPILSKCGALYRLFLLGFYHNLLTDKRNQLHTFFLCKNHRSRSWCGNQTIFKMKKVTYVVPEVEELKVVVEQGFAQSQLENPEVGEED